MGRSSCDFILPQPANDLAAMVDAYLVSEGYTFKHVEGEMVYQKGAGITMGPTFIRFLVNGVNVRLEVWMKYAVLPGVYAGEIDNKSFVGCAVKGPLKDRMSRIEMMVMQRGGQLIARDTPANPTVFPPVYQQPQMPQYQPQYQQPVQQYQPLVQQYQPPVQPQLNAGGIVCKDCGTINPQGSSFCQNCGQRINNF